MSFIQYEVQGMVAVLTIDRPKALNALNSAVLEEMDAVIDAIDLNTVRCLVITGSGEKSFVAGADIGEMSTLTKAEGEAFGKKGNDVFRKIETLPIPVIAAINGFALGGGNELAMLQNGYFKEIYHEYVVDCAAPQHFKYNNMEKYNTIEEFLASKDAKINTEYLKYILHYLNFEITDKFIKKYDHTLQKSKRILKK